MLIQVSTMKRGNQMKYVAKFVNSYWVSFNTETYENVQVFYLRKDAMEVVKKMNQQGGK